MKERWCSACGELFQVRPQSPSQAFCAKQDCQRERKLLWQRTKRKSDPDYAANQAKASAAWAKRNPDYWRSYRARRVEGNLSESDIAGLFRQMAAIAREDASSQRSAEATTSRTRHASFAVEIPLGDFAAISLFVRLELGDGQTSS
ncbi:hypothetical protein [Hydrogenophaga crocea]|uniref:Uncharacterized protein n=1 Tax=Hydrogenophaga crocea TaxID=2716225 RepID=A0A6G8IJA4_9BURK|nr:hypothetical protein [Hydrogenophaga crocea]QIM53163.1 hypothetical protein G9Q37_13890 [Hydrogenophaga crocea]